MQTFVQFIAQREITKTYINQQFTVLALYAEYVAWLARQPQEGQAIAGRFSASELLVQLELINQYQIQILNTYALTNNTGPIALTEVPEYLKHNGINYLNQRPAEVAYSKGELPDGVTRAINNTLQTLPPGTQRFLKGLILVAAALSATCFYLTFGGLALPLAVDLLAGPLAWVAALSAVRSILDLNEVPPNQHGHWSNTSIAIWATIGIGTALALIAVPFFTPLSSLTMLILDTVSFASIYFAADHGIGKIRLAAVKANKATHAPEAIINTLDQIDHPNVGNTSLSLWQQPVNDKLKLECGQLANKLDEAVTATTHCFLASRFTGREEGTLSIHELDQNLQKRLRA
jgi:hypothetical protein